MHSLNVLLRNRPSRLVCASARNVAAVCAIHLPMAGFLYRCPNTGQLVQGWSAEDVQNSEDSYESVTCLACSRLHFVNRGTGKVLGSEDRE